MYRHCVYVLTYVCIYNIYIYNIYIEVKSQGEGGQMGSSSASFLAAPTSVLHGNKQTK